MQLQTLVPDTIWHVAQPVGSAPLRFTSRMTIVRRADGSLWVHSPCRPEPAVARRIRELGEVRDVVAPNLQHHFFLGAFLAEFPQAQGWIAPGLANKRAELAYLPPLDEAARARWQPDLQGVFIEGLPLLNETVWFHESSRTLIVTDLLLCIGRDNPAPLRFAAGLVGALGRVAMGRHVRLCVRDRRAFARSVAAVLALDFDRLVPAHDRIVETDARAAAAEALDWVGRGRLFS